MRRQRVCVCPSSRRHSLQVVELSQRFWQADVQILLKPPTPSNCGPIYRFWSKPNMLTRWMTDKSMSDNNTQTSLDLRYKPYTNAQTQFSYPLTTSPPTSPVPNTYIFRTLQQLFTSHPPHSSLACQLR